MLRRIQHFIDVLNCAHKVFDPLKKLTFEAFWYLFVLREIWHWWHWLARP